MAAAAPAHPRIKPISQFNDPTTTLDGSDCTMAAGVMLGELATGKRLYPGQLRALQSDQEGGTSIPDVARAWSKAYPGTPLHYASSDDGTPIPAGKTGSTITAQGLWEQLLRGDGAVLQGVYGIFEVHGYSLQPGFKDGHAIYLDGVRTFGVVPARQGYAIDPLGRAGYKGQWIPWPVLVEYGLALGRGGFYAAWAPPHLPDSSTGDTVQQTYDFIPGKSTAGKLTVSAKGHAYQRLADGKLHEITPGPEWTDRPGFGPVKLHVPIPGGRAGADRTTAVVVGIEAAAVLVSDGTFTPDKAGDCRAAVNAALDHVAGPAADVITAIKEARPA